ncbi:restriction endonuclease subunit S [Nocardioides islandensis]|uniref:Restriction endonuclease subunit S n=1 Tax=Nocardioides islandensis TaxID=433663 RepID=A0A930VEK2_9ACTN|nr:restriction endonuclease subunit S [Nocardioides islandensis]MBF4763370.1 restriction endonuclease subunit S [Nocardioides islandensis]
MTTLGDVCTVRSSLVDPTRPEFARLPHIAPDSIEKGSGRLRDYRTAGEDGVTSGKYRFEAGDVLYSKIRPNLNKVALVDLAGVCSADMYALDVDRNLAIPEYVAYVLRSQDFLDYATSLSNRANIPKLNREQLLRFDLHLPPVPEQRRIAAILDHADALRAKRRQILTHVDALTQSIFNEMFVTEIWSSTLGEIANVQIGPFGSLLHKEDYVSGGVPVINPMHIRDGQLQPDGEFSVTDTKAASLSLYRLHEGDVVLGRRGEMGRAGVAGPGHDGMLCGTGSLILRPRAVDSRFLHSVVTSPRMKSHLERSALGATLPNLNATIVKTSPAPRASDRAQAEFAEALGAVDESLNAVRRAATKDDELFASLEARAFRGEL